MVDLDDHLVVDDLRIVPCLGKRQDAADRQPDVDQQLDPVIRGPGSEDGSERGGDFLHRHHPVLVGGVPVPKVRQFEGLAQAGEVVVRDDGEGDVAVVGGEHLIRRSEDRGRSDSSRLSVLVKCDRIPSSLDGHQLSRRCHVDPPARSTRLGERGAHPGHQVGGGDVVPDRGGGLGWRAALGTGDRDHSRFRLKDDVDSRPTRVRPVRAEGRCHSVDDRRVVTPHVILAEAQSFDRPGTQIVDEDVGRLDEIPCPTATRVGPEIDDL
jgi:hypothetical protein